MATSNSLRCVEAGMGWEASVWVFVCGLLGRSALRKVNIRRAGSSESHMDPYNVLHMERG